MKRLKLKSGKKIFDWIIPNEWNIKDSYILHSSGKKFAEFKKNNLWNIKYNGVSINTKSLKKNDLFFALKGKKTDGHQFIKDAFKKKAIKAIISKKLKQVSKNKIIKVKNTLYSLKDLAKVTRDVTSAKIIGITGSVGKTTSKNLIGFALSNYGETYQSPYSYNNKFGVPLSVSN